MSLHKQMPSSQRYSLHSILQAIPHTGFLNTTPDNLKSLTVEVHRPLDATFAEPAGRFASKTSKGRLTLPPSRTHALQAPAAVSQLERNAPWPTASSPDHTFDPTTRSLNPASTTSQTANKKEPRAKARSSHDLAAFKRKMPLVGQRRPALPRTSSAVPSALGGLTSGFGMGPGVPPLPWSLTNKGHSVFKAGPPTRALRAAQRDSRRPPPPRSRLTLNQSQRKKSSTY